MNLNRRNFLRGSTLVGAGLGTEMVASRTASAQHEQHQQRGQHQKHKAPPQPEAPPKPKKPSSGPTVVPVETPDVPKLPWTVENGVKIFHLTAEVVKREFLPASHMGSARVADVWGFNGCMPGPTIEVNEGDRVRVIIHNKLPEGFTIHWHGVEVPIEMDGMPFISQPIVQPGGMFTYEFMLKQNGTFFYHSHMVNQMVSMVGPVATAGHGAQTGKGMEEGMGIIRDSSALSSDLAPGFGRGLGPTVEREKQISNLVGQAQPQQSGQPHTGKAPASPPQTPQGGHQHGATPADETDRRRVPGYPQDMHMIMDEAVAKPETYGLAPGWSGAVVGMMTLVRVLPPDKYEEVMAKVREGRQEKPPQSPPTHKHGG